jgi:hypothetical protein
MRNYIFLTLIFISASSHAQVNYASFVGKKSAITFSKQYTFANLYDYTNHTKGGTDSALVVAIGGKTPEQLLATKYNYLLQKNTADSISSKIILSARLVLQVGNKRHTFIKYKLVTNGIKATNFELIDFVNENGGWQENQNSTEELETIKSVFLISPVDTFYLFYNKKDNEKYPEINKLKPFAKNESGDLDIKLMEKVIKQNKAQIAKYLD